MALHNYLVELLFILDILISGFGRSPAYRQRKADFSQIYQSSKNSRYVQRAKSSNPLAKTSLPDDKGNFIKKSKLQLNMVNEADSRGWLAGLTDGEGCFCVSFNKKEKLSLGLETRPSFSISQKAPSKASLEKVQKILDCGFLRYSAKDGTYKYEVRDLNDLVHKVIPFFEKYCLETAKAKDFEKFKKICINMKQGLHLNEDGLKDILQEAYSMNPSGKRKASYDELTRSIKSKKDS